jgi:hypothetical protein
VTTRIRCSILSLCHQRRDIHQSTYLYLLEDRDSSSLNAYVEHPNQRSYASWASILMQGGPRIKVGLKVKL